MLQMRIDSERLVHSYAPGFAQIARFAPSGLVIPAKATDIEAEFLLYMRQEFGLGVDTLSLDYGPSTESPVHRLWLPSGRYGIECLAILAAIPPAGSTLVVGAPKFQGGTGGPSRIFALY